MAIEVRTSKKKGRRYVVKVRDRSGRWYPTECFDRKVEAEVHERDLLIQRDRGSKAPTIEARNLTVQEYWNLWAVDCRAKVSDGWQSSQDQMARDYIFPIIGSLRILEVRAQDIANVLNRARTRVRSEQTVLHVYNILHKIFEDAVEHYEYPLTSPVKKRYRPKVIVQERDFLKPQDSWRLLERVRSHWAGSAVWLSILTALRAGEIQFLTWKSVDLDRGEILVRGTYNRKERRMQEYPKSTEYARVPMPPMLVEYLAALRVGKDREDFVCPGQTGKMLNYESFLRVLTRMLDKAGIRRLTPHGLRHSSTELWVDQGASAEDVRRLLNHSSLSVTKRYIHRTDERLQGLAAKIRAPEPPQGPGHGPAPEPAAPSVEAGPAAALPQEVRPKLRLVSCS